LFSFAQGNWRHLNNGFVKETGIVELTRKITAAYASITSATCINNDQTPKGWRRIAR
jgi:hypothetical protein